MHSQLQVAAAGDQDMAAGEHAGFIAGQKRDRAGNIRNIYSSGTLDVRLVLADVKTLLLEETHVTAR